MSEELCDEADELLRETPEGGIVDLAVDASGNATPLHVRIAWRTFP
jgi:hypothetical protein